MLIGTNNGRMACVIAVFDVILRSKGDRALPNMPITKQQHTMKSVTIKISATGGTQTKPTTKK